MSVQVNQTEGISDNGGTTGLSVPDYNGGIVSWPYLSVPAGVRGNACVYAFGPVNQTATDGSCGGVFSVECSKHLLEKVRDNSRNASGGNGECEQWLESDEERARVQEMCGFTNDRALVCEFSLSLFPICSKLEWSNGQDTFSDNGTQRS